MPRGTVLEKKSKEEAKAKAKAGKPRGRENPNFPSWMPNRSLAGGRRFCSFLFCLLCRRSSLVVIVVQKLQLSSILSSPSALSEAEVASSIGPHGCPATVAHVFVTGSDACNDTCSLVGSGSRLGQGTNGGDLLHLLLEAALKASRTVAAAARPIRTARSIIAGRRRTIAPSPGTDSHRQTLNGSARRPLTGSLTGKHTVVDGKVTTDHIRLLGSTIAGEGFGGIRHLCTVFAVVDTDFAEVAVAGMIGFIERFGPLTALADAGQIHHVEHVGSNQVVCGFEVAVELVSSVYCFQWTAAAMCLECDSSWFVWMLHNSGGSSIGIASAGGSATI